MKRLIEVLISGLCLILLLPLFLVIGAVIKAESQGPVFFRQERVGKGFLRFRIYKFRTMVQDASETGPLVTAGGDRRVTRLGVLLRQTKVDELAQLINVFVGDMSFVGPRPEVPRYADEYRESYAKILRVKPGITDMSSIIFRDEEKLLQGRDNPEEYYRRTLLPLKLRIAEIYVENASMLLDFRILLDTVAKVVCPDWKRSAYMDRLLGDLLDGTIV
jgi:lipopolysaccharide/colanic/teichoic acid biosynthesis glycosyltransferase